PRLACALTAEVTGGGDANAFTITTEGAETRVVLSKGPRGWRMVCPACGHGCRFLLYRGFWGCRSCGGRLRYRTDNPSPMLRRSSILRRLARADPLSCL